MPKKICSDCGDEKDTSLFFNNPTGYYGVRGNCKECHTNRSGKRLYANTASTLKREWAEAPYQVMLEIIKSDPDLQLVIANKHPLLYKRLLYEKRSVIGKRLEAKREYYKKRAARSAATKRATHAARKLAQVS